MFDWFVVLVPIAVLPIVLLFAFVGCVLDREGQFPSGRIRFTYAADLHQQSAGGPALNSIEWRYNLDLESDAEFGEGQIGNPPGGVNTETFERGGNSGKAIAAGGESVDFPIHTDTYGPIKCYCTVVTEPGEPFGDDPQTFNLGPLLKQKVEDEDGPVIELTRSGAGFELS